jgi:hypothetical protein
VARQKVEVLQRPRVREPNVGHRPAQQHRPQRQHNAERTYQQSGSEHKGCPCKPSDRKQWRWDDCRAAR